MLKMIGDLFGKTTNVNVAELVSNGAVVIDVRTPDEFRSGHLKNSLNIPLDNLANMIDKVRDLKKPVVAVCRSGTRSGMAVGLLKKAGIEAFNGGAWDELGSRLRA